MSTHLEITQGAAEADARNAALNEHLAVCPACQEEEFGYCELASTMIANPEPIHPERN